MSKTNLGQFLYSERMRRGYESVTDYLKDYVNLPISEPYYRDIETGRKIINIDKAETLCKALNVNVTEFFYHLLNDILPQNIAKVLIKQIPTNTFSMASEEFKKLDQKLETVKKAYEGRLLEEAYLVDNEIVKYLDENFEILPLIHFIYAKEICNFKEVREIIAKNGIEKSFDEILGEFEKLKIARIDYKKNTIARFKRIFRIPRNDSGIELKDRFLKKEIDISIKDNNREQIIAPNNTYIYSAITCVKKGESLKKISSKLIEFIAELEAGESNLDENSATPYFVAIVFSSREKYDIDKKWQKTTSKNGHPSNMAGK